MPRKTSSLPAKPDLTRFNAISSGVLSRYTVLPWEEAADYEGLLQSLQAEYKPGGPTEAHLVEELAGIFWRKRRLRMAEGATIQETLYDRVAGTSQHRATAEKEKMVRVATVLEGIEGFSRDTADPVAALTTPMADTVSTLADMEALLDAVNRAFATLEREDQASYEKAVKMLGEVTRDWWEEELEGEGYKPTPEGLAKFLDGEAAPFLLKEVAALKSRGLVRDYALAASLDPIKMDNLSRYEVHLDRKLEKTLTMLLRLQELRKQGE